MTGSVEKGESLVQAAAREAFEETGLAGRTRPIKMAYRFEFVSRWGEPVTEHGYALEVPQMASVRLDCHEHVNYEWVSYGAARRKICFESNRKLLDLLARKLRKAGLNGSLRQTQVRGCVQSKLQK